jgi:hypothetical protein
MDQYHVGISAEAFAAALFAQVGCDVLVQYGANQPGYDLMVARGGINRKISVKGSQDGGWGLIQNFKNASRTYHEAIDAWVSNHKDADTLYCFVQFKGAELGEMPRVYLCTISEAASYLRQSRGGHGYTSLREAYKWASGIAGGAVDEIPKEWRISAERISMYLPAH